MSDPEKSASSNEENRIDLSALTPAQRKQFLMEQEAAHNASIDVSDEAMAAADLLGDEEEEALAPFEQKGEASEVEEDTSKDKGLSGVESVENPEQAGKIAEEAEAPEVDSTMPHIEVPDDFAILDNEPGVQKLNEPIPEFKEPETRSEIQEEPQAASEMNEEPEALDEAFFEKQDLEPDAAIAEEELESRQEAPVMSTVQLKDIVGALELSKRLPANTLFGKKKKFLLFLNETVDVLEHPHPLTAKSVSHLADFIDEMLPVIRNSEKFSREEKNLLREWSKRIAKLLSRGKPPARIAKDPATLSPREQKQEAIFEEFEFLLMQNLIIHSEIFKNEKVCLYHHPYVATLSKRVQLERLLGRGAPIRLVLQYVTITLIIAGIIMFFVDL